MMDDWGWGGWLAGCFAMIVVTASAVGVFYLLLRANETSSRSTGEEP